MRWGCSVCWDWAVTTRRGILHELRRAMVRPGWDRLAGTVEVDETFLGGPKPENAAAERQERCWFWSRRRDGPRIGRIRLRRIADASGPTLEAAIQSMIAPGSTVRTDTWRGYNGLQARGYSHEVIRQETTLGDNLLPLANRVAFLLKRWLLGTHQGAVRPSHLDYYLDEFTFRFNRRTSGSRGKLFYRLVQQALILDPVPAKLISGDARKS